MGFKFAFEYFFFLFLLIIVFWFGSLLIEKISEASIKNSIYRSLSKISQDWAQVKVTGLKVTIEGSTPSKIDGVKTFTYLRNNYLFLEFEDKTTSHEVISFFNKISFIKVFKDKKHFLLLGSFPEEGINELNRGLIPTKKSIKNMIQKNEETFDKPLEKAIGFLKTIILKHNIIIAQLTRKSLSIKIPKPEPKREEILKRNAHEFHKKQTYPKINIEYFTEPLIVTDNTKEPAIYKDKNQTKSQSPKEVLSFVIKKKDSSIELKGFLSPTIRSDIIRFISSRYPSLTIKNNIVASKNHNFKLTNIFIESINLVNVLENFRLTLNIDGLEIYGEATDEIKARKTINQLLIKTNYSNKINIVKIKKLKNDKKETKLNQKKKSCQNHMLSLNYGKALSFTRKSYEISGYQQDYFLSLIKFFKKCSIFKPSLIGYGDNYLSSAHSNELGLARASSVYLKILDIEQSIGWFDIFGETSKNLFKLEHNQQMNNIMQKIEVRLNG